MKCQNEGCPNDAICFIVHVTQEQVYYCEDHFAWYNQIMLAMGSFAPIPFPITQKENKE